MTWPAAATTAPDPKRWIALVVLSMLVPNIPADVHPGQLLETKS
jgi:hypothetical protein